jgi:hypothetical protein
MSTTHHSSAEAVEAAITYMLIRLETEGDIDKQHAAMAVLERERWPNEPMHVIVAARILAAEVERLRAEMDRRHKEYSTALNRRVDVENALAMVAAAKRPVLTPDECRALVIKLGLSPAEPKNKA